MLVVATEAERETTERLLRRACSCVTASAAASGTTYTIGGAEFRIEDDRFGIAHRLTGLSFDAAVTVGDLFTATATDEVRRRLVNRGGELHHGRAALIEEIVVALAGADKPTPADGHIPEPPAPKVYDQAEADRLAEARAFINAANYAHPVWFQFMGVRSGYDETQKLRAEVGRLEDELRRSGVMVRLYQGDADAAKAEVERLRETIRGMR